ncbi:MAG TPA: pitrilysin family protein [Polyangiaceae bacterium]|nr:pitrilysin family protein [Polyangiaceae bacterium]
MPRLTMLLAAALVSAPLSALAAPQATTTPAPGPPARDPVLLSLDRLALSIQRRTLPNGLRVVLNPDPASPTVGVSVTYDVGSRNEATGGFGFAHLFEHLMFQGSRHVKKGDHFTLVSERGGSLNGTTAADRTNYFEVVPATELELVLWLEADRMRWLDVSATNFENQRAVVKEEYRMRVDNAAYAAGYLRLEELVFADYAPYAHPTIGNMADLDRAQLPWVQDFYARHYGPNNAVLTIAGNFDVDQALGWVERYFSGAEARKPPPYAPPATPAHTRPQRERVEDKNAKTEALLYGWLIPAAHTPDHYALELAALLLGDGESARLHQALVKKLTLAQRTSAYTRDYRGLDVFGANVVLSERAKLGELEKALDAEIAALSKTPPTASELLRVKRRLRASYVFGLQSNMRRAMELGEYELFWGDARGIARELEHYLSVTPADVQRVVAQYLTNSNRCVIEIAPPPGAAKAALPAKAPAPVSKGKP